MPLLAFKLYPPEVKQGAEVADWAAGELRKMGGLSPQGGHARPCWSSSRWLLWIFGEPAINSTTVALAVLCGIVLTGIVTWDEVLGNKQAWNTLAWFATLVALAGGLAQVGFVAWFAAKMGGLVAGVPPPPRWWRWWWCSSCRTTCSPRSPPTRPRCCRCS